MTGPAKKPNRLIDGIRRTFFLRRKPSRAALAFRQGDHRQRYNSCVHLVSLVNFIFPLVESFHVVEVRVEVQAASEVQEAVAHTLQLGHLVGPRGHLLVVVPGADRGTVDPFDQLVGSPLDPLESFAHGRVLFPSPVVHI